LRDLLAKPQTAHVPFKLRDYRAADFDRLWQIDQLCFPNGISYTQMELSGFITQRSAITLVAEAAVLPTDDKRSAASSLHPKKELTHPAPGTRQAHDARTIVGFAIAHGVRKKAGRILTLDILPEARRMRLGSMLMDECERRLRLFGCQEMYLETAVNNEPALRLYLKLGYQILRTLPDYYASHSLDAYLMGKAL
jgi:ribosomal-protein-alanine N-acetyltransferase